VSTLRLALLAVAALASAGCTALPGTTLPDSVPPDMGPVVKPEAPPAVSESPPAVSEVDNLLRYFQQLKKLSGTELGKEHDNVRQAYLKERSEFNRVRLAMILSLPNTSFGDDSRALELLDPTVRNQQASLYGLAFLLSAHLQERRKLDGSIQNLQQNLQGLQQKLDALKSLERSLIEREQGGPKKR
jgi:hypothetical protein